MTRIKNVKTLFYIYVLEALLALFHSEDATSLQHHVTPLPTSIDLTERYSHGVNMERFASVRDTNVIVVQNRLHAI